MSILQYPPHMASRNFAFTEACTVIVFTNTDSVKTRV